MAAREFQTFDAESTRALAARLAEGLTGGTLVLLEGELGSGKTTFAQGLARGLGVVGRVASPSFTISREYPTAGGRPRFAHLDLYRLTHVMEVADLAVEELLDDGCVVAVEWPERGGASLSSGTVHVRLTDVGGPRRIAIAGCGRAEAAVAGLVVPEGVCES